ncbi:MAG: LysR family transcriptional regulator [Pseudomonadota bacterium]
MKRSDLPYLDDLRAFEVTARMGSVRSAAEELNLTHAAVSRRASRLAKTVGTPLLERSGRGIRLTSAGEALRDACRRSFDDLERTISSIRETAQEDSNTILLSCERSVAMRWLIPRLSQFETVNPDIAVHLSVGGGAIDTARDHGFLALRRLDFSLDAKWAVNRLFPETVGPVMVETMRERFAAEDYVALVSKTRPDAWDDWLSANPTAPRPREMREMDHHFLVVEAACAGLGVGLSPRVIALDDVSSGRLIAPCGFDADGSEYGLIYRADGTLAPNVKRLADWIEGLCESFETNDGRAC